MEPLYWERTKMNLHYLFFEQETYELLFNMFSEMVIRQFHEEASFNGTRCWLEKRYFNKEIKDKLKELDESKPLIKPGSYIFNLFYEPQENWGSRGTPHLWQAMAREFSNDMIFNTTKGMFKEKYLRIFKELTGKDLYGIEEETFYCENYAFGGMSSGFIWVDFFKKELEHLLNEFND